MTTLTPTPTPTPAPTPTPTPAPTPTPTPAPAPLTTATPLLAVDDVSLAFAGVRALDGVSFAVAGGEICAVIGPNGAGKSSLLNVISGLYRPSGGSITFAGQRRARMQPYPAARRGIARTFQNLGLFKGMTVVENLLAGRNAQMRAGIVAQALGARWSRREEKEQRAVVDELVTSLELDAVRDLAAGKLPYGLQKRVELGRALAQAPRLLLLDEPMAGMSYDEKRDLCRFILDANQRLGTTVVLIEHDMGVVMELADHVVVLDYGRKIADGTPAEVRAHPAVLSAYLGAAA
jgi:branched-chain amino acid transport system ATP-binding protein